jgi:hypothetical protein
MPVESLMCSNVSDIGHLVNRDKRPSTRHADPVPTSITYDPRECLELFVALESFEVRTIEAQVIELVGDCPRCHHQMAVELGLPKKRAVLGFGGAGSNSSSNGKEWPDHLVVCTCAVDHGNGVGSGCGAFANADIVL